MGKNAGEWTALKLFQAIHGDGDAGSKFAFNAQNPALPPRWEALAEKINAAFTAIDEEFIGYNKDLQKLTAQLADKQRALDYFEAQWRLKDDLLTVANAAKEELHKILGKKRVEIQGLKAQLKAAKDAKERCAICGHEWRIHDPEDGKCDAHSSEGHGVCKCGRDLNWMLSKAAALSRAFLNPQQQDEKPWGEKRKP